MSYYKTKKCCVDLKSKMENIYNNTGNNDIISTEPITAILEQSFDIES